MKDKVSYPWAIKLLLPKRALIYCTHISILGQNVVDQCHHQALSVHNTQKQYDTIL